MGSFTRFKSHIIAQGGISGPGTLAPAGQFFWLDGVNGSNSNSGRTQNKPKLTFKAALALCVAGRNDHIFVNDYWQPDGEDWPILVNKSKVHIIGVALPNLMSPAIHPPENTAVFEIANTGQYSEIAGFMIGGGNGHGGIETGSIANGMGNGLYMHDCWFGHEWFGTPLAGFRNLGTINACGIRIERCSFFGDLANCCGKITGTAIDNALGAAGWFDKCEIIDCDFFGTYIGVHFHRARDCKILRNRFVCANAIDGEAVTLETAVRGCMVDGNVAMYGGVAASFTLDPYRDIAATDKNHWGVNWKTNAVAVPKQE